MAKKKEPSEQVQEDTRQAAKARYHKWREEQDAAAQKGSQ
jgi:hypothetical protein